MPYQIAVLVWLLLIVSVVFSVILAITYFAIAGETGNKKATLTGIALVFLSVILGWGIWVVYPLTGIG